MKKLLSALLSLALCLCLWPVAGISDAAPPEGYALVSQSGDIALHANAETGEIIIEDTRDGFLWRSNPQEADAKAKGIHKMTLQSAVVIGYSSERGTALTATSVNDSVKRDGFSMIIESGEAVAFYDFPKQEISLKVYYRLTDGCLEASVPVEDIVSYGLNTLTSVELLPAFGAGGPDEDGFMLVPDGSGAIINFNNGVTAANEYKANVYGRDPSVTGQLGLSTSPATARTYEQTVRLPVFGVNKGGRGFIAIITENDSKAVLHARVSNLTSYNYVYSEFQLRNAGSMIMNRKEFEQSIAGVSEREGLTRGSYTVRYCFLSGADAGCAGMARAYREYLIAEKGLEKRTEPGEYPLYLDLYGYVNKTAHILGIPYVKAVPLTTMDDAREIIAAIGVPQTVARYKQFLRGSAYGKLPSNANIQGVLGSKKELTALADALQSQGGRLFPDVDMINVYKPGNGFRPLLDAVLAPVNAPQMQYQINYGDSKLDPAVAPWYLLSPIKYDKFYSRFVGSYKSLGINGLSLSAIGGVLTSDNRTGGMGRQDAQGAAVNVLRMAAEQIGDILLDGGNGYAAALACHVLEAPANSSQFMLCDAAVPFWQMVFHGYVSYSLTPVNQAGDAEKMLLKCLEYGASPLYALAGRNHEQLMDSRMLYLFSGDAGAWTAAIQDHYARLSQVLAPLSDAPITGYEILSEQVRCTVYGDTRVYVNYGDSPYAAADATVPPRGFVIKEATP